MGQATAQVNRAAPPGDKDGDGSTHEDGEGKVDVSYIQVKATPVNLLGKCTYFQRNFID
jgi:hypothetical protein